MPKPRALQAHGQNEELQQHVLWTSQKQKGQASSSENGIANLLHLHVFSVDARTRLDVTSERGSTQLLQDKPRH
eukprot:6490442-Amphidinium_carterae.2